MYEIALSKSIRGALEAAGVWCLECSPDDGRPELLLPEYCAWLRVGSTNEAWDEHARKRGVEVVTVAGVHEALIQVSLWQMAHPKANLPGWLRARAKHIKPALRVVR